MVRKRLDLLLVERGLFESRTKAQAAIEAGGVAVDGRAEVRASDLVPDTAVITAEPAHPWVGRGALKLAHALDLWPAPVKDLVVLDVGASTGGFTEVCLSRGAAKVYAVDVGRDQFHPRLRADERVVCLEGTDARALNADLIPDEPRLIVCDVSFIGLAKALPAALALGGRGCSLLALVKPQFEVGPEKVGKGGLVKEEAHRREALEAIEHFLTACDWHVRATAESPVVGGDGNHEYLLWAVRL